MQRYYCSSSLTCKYRECSGVTGVLDNEHRYPFGKRYKITEEAAMYKNTDCVLKGIYFVKSPFGHLMEQAIKENENDNDGK